MNLRLNNEKNIPYNSLNHSTLFEIKEAKLCKSNDKHEITVQQKYESDSSRLTNCELHHRRCTSPQRSKMIDATHAGELVRTH
jgi:hypothetical protein